MGCSGSKAGIGIAINHDQSKTVSVRSVPSQQVRPLDARALAEANAALQVLARPATPTKESTSLVVGGQQVLPRDHTNQNSVIYIFGELSHCMKLR